MTTTEIEEIYVQLSYRKTLDDLVLTVWHVGRELSCLILNLKAWYLFQVLLEFIGWFIIGKYKSR